MKIGVKELKKEREFVAKILEAKGMSYNEWLHQAHQECIETNQITILEALSAFNKVEEKQESPKYVGHMQGKN